MKGASYVGKPRTLYAVTADGSIVGTRTTPRVYTHALVVLGRDGVRVVLSWHLGAKNAEAKRKSWATYEPSQPVQEVAEVMEAPEGRAVLEASLAARRGVSRHAAEG